MIPSDLRAYAQALLTTLPSQMLLPYLHPVFYSLHNMPKDVSGVQIVAKVVAPLTLLWSPCSVRHSVRSWCRAAVTVAVVS